MPCPATPKSSHRLPRLLNALEGRRPRHPDPEGSQGGVREAALIQSPYLFHHQFISACRLRANGGAPCSSSKSWTNHLRFLLARLAPAPGSVLSLSVLRCLWQKLRWPGLFGAARSQKRRLGIGGPEASCSGLPGCSWKQPRNRVRNSFETPCFSSYLALLQGDTRILST
jgi:hypothetical protein